MSAFDGEEIRAERTSKRTCPITGEEIDGVGIKLPSSSEDRIYVSIKGLKKLKDYEEEKSIKDRDGVDFHNAILTNFGDHDFDSFCLGCREEINANDEILELIDDGDNSKQFFAHPGRIHTSCIKEFLERADPDQTRLSQLIIEETKER